MMRRSAMVLVVLCAFVGSVASSARAAEFGIVPGGFAVRLLDSEGHLEVRAGSHPDRLQAEFELEVEGTGTTPSDLAFDLPAGFAANPGAVPPCPRQGYDEGQECPPESQVGVIELGLTEGGEGELPIFVLEAGPGELPSFVSKPSFEITLAAKLRPGDFGTTLEVTDLPEASLDNGKVELWGVPADHQVGTTIPRRPLLTAPTRCGPLPFTFRTRSAEPEAPWLSAETDAEAPLSGCEGLAFDPQLGMELTTPIADSPTGARVDLDLPEEGGPDDLAAAQLEGASIFFPAGTTLSPGGAAGLTACSDAELGLGDSNEARCPPSSRVGAVEFESTILSGALDGSVYLGQEHPGERFRLFVVANRQGAAVKFIAALKTDPSGRIGVELKDLPQIALSHLALTIDGGPRALLASPLACGSYAAVGTFVPYGGGSPVESTAPIAVHDPVSGSGCSGSAPFAPSLAMAGSSSRAGRPTGFSFGLHRKSGEQLPRRFSVTLPAGLSASLGSVQPCRDPLAAAGCPDVSRVGEVLGEIGSGSSVTGLRGNVYLSGPYRGAPFSIAMALHAAIGPFDLGTIVVRAMLRIDPASGRVTVATEQIPSVFEGIQIRFRTLEMSLGGAGFMRNPTSCAPSSFDSSVEAAGGGVVLGSTPFSVKGCGKLRFRPRIRMALLAREELRLDGRPGMRVSVRFRPTDANLRSMKLSFPDALKFRNSAVREICARPDAREGSCPKNARVGTVQAETPILSAPLTGAIYVVQPQGTGTPDLWVSLTGMGVNINLPGHSLQGHGNLVTKFVASSDVPISRLTMRFPSGKDGPFALDRRICLGGRPLHLASSVDIEGQNGARHRLRVPLEAHPGCRKPAAGLAE